MLLVQRYPLLFKLQLRIASQVHRPKPFVASIQSLSSAPPSRAPPRAPMKRSAPGADHGAAAAGDAPPPRSRVRVLTWNIDMDTEPINLRCRALVDAVRAARPDVVMLQEVTSRKDAHRDSSVLRILRRRLCVEPATPDAPPAFDMHMQPDWAQVGYFAVLLIRRGLFRPGSVHVASRPFPRSIMGRALVAVDGETAPGARLAVLTAHLESLPIGSAARTAQLASIIELQRAYAARGFASVFAGDTNLREKEVPAADIAKTEAAEKKRAAAVAAASSGAAAGPGRKKARVEPLIGDAWLMAGAPPKMKFTWDTSRNDNLDMDVPYKPKARYDRMFVLGPHGKFPEVNSFKLLGTERLSACDKFISDHFGVLVDIDLTT